MWINVCKALPSQRGKELLEDFFDLANLDNLHFHITRCRAHRGEYMRSDPVFGKYMVAGGLLDARHVTSHERRARNWDEAQFIKYFDSLQVQCLQLSAALYGAHSPQHAETKAQCTKCFRSFTDCELESLVFKLACRMVRPINLSTKSISI